MKISAVLLNTVLLFVVNSTQAELLGHISEDDAQPAPASVAAPQNDRKIIYRVICDPNGEILPDCEKPSLTDTATPPATPANTVPVIAEDKTASHAEQQPSTHHALDHTKHVKHAAKAAKTKKVTAAKHRNRR